jgi:hypothetical protein
MKTLTIMILTLAIFPFLAVILSSCSHYYYVPNVKNIPLLREKNEGRVSLNFGSGDESTSVEVQAAYALTDNIAVMSDFMSVKGGQSSGEHDWAKGTYFDGAIGYFKPMNTFTVFEIYGGLGSSSQYHKYYNYSWNSPTSDAGHANLIFTKLFIQPSFGLTFNWADLAFSTPVSRVIFHEIDNNINGGEKHGLDLITENRSSSIFEPTITVRGGWKYVKLQFQYVHLINLTKRELPFETDKISFGIYISIAGKYWKDY